ncbi:hypothetical protein GYMLUDRAFT_946159 [Collybiopsis luxurians FD-317 M1]|uniref:DNA breaking-rejoining enzyme n=1 Tax=Collybiopsis luxurians FD-317 M1 TaxID=944289 RepID=A0A0D0BTU5_9AGAR|nr:hypothetical protein GYMLUDRAFT_946159 [Collybiopsis luxurians FD-317 M1]
MSRHTLTPAAALALAYTSAASGAHIDFYQAGEAKTTNETLDGLRQLASTSSSSSSLGKPNHITTIKLGETTKESSRAGGRVGAETEPRTLYSETFIKSLLPANSTSIPATFPVPITRQTPSPEVPSAHPTFSSPEFPSLTPWHSSSSITMPHSQQPSYASMVLLESLITQLSLSGNPTDHSTNNGSWKKKEGFLPSSKMPGSRLATSTYPAASPLPVRNVNTPSKHCYPSNLTPLPSTLRPHCPAHERLITWKPACKRTFLDAAGHPLILPDEFIERVQQVLVHGYAESTLETYASGLLAFHVFCDSRSIPEDQRASCSGDLLNTWMATMTGNYAGTSVKNYVHGVRAWHIIHGVRWNIDKATFDTMIQGAERLQPERSRRKKRQPFTPDYITKLLEDLDTTNPLDVACGGCLTTSFFCAARVGELTVPTLRDFSPEKYITPSDVRNATDRNGFQTTILHIPHTKSSQIKGEDLYFSRQLGSADPDSWLHRQFTVNKPGPSEHLFTYSHTTSNKTTRRPLTKSAFIQRIHKAAKNKGLPALQGHGIRIGATLEYLLRGVPFDAVRVIGRWKSDAFLLYLRKHAEIMAPYMQPELHQAFISYTMPPVR